MYMRVMDISCDHVSSAAISMSRVAQSVARLTQEPEVPGSILGPATYFRFPFRLFKKGSCQLLAKVWALSTGQPFRRSKPVTQEYM